MTSFGSAKLNREWRGYSSSWAVRNSPVSVGKQVPMTPSASCCSSALILSAVRKASTRSLVPASLLFSRSLINLFTKASVAGDFDETKYESVEVTLPARGSGATVETLSAGVPWITLANTRKVPAGETTAIIIDNLLLAFQLCLNYEQKGVDDIYQVWQI